jgi:hypothetical protein
LLCPRRSLCWGRHARRAIPPIPTPGCFARAGVVSRCGLASRWHLCGAGLGVSVPVAQRRRSLCTRTHPLMHAHTTHTQTPQLPPPPPLPSLPPVPMDRLGKGAAASASAGDLRVLAGRPASHGDAARSGGASVGTGSVGTGSVRGSAAGDARPSSHQLPKLATAVVKETFDKGEWWRWCSCAPNFVFPPGSRQPTNPTPCPPPPSVHVAVDAAGGLYGIHFETAAERRWRTRPPVEERARHRAQKSVGGLMDTLVSSEHEAQFGWPLSKCVRGVACGWGWQVHGGW